MNLSPHFTLEELARSETALRRGFPNVPNLAQVENLRRLCLTLLEPARRTIGFPLHVNSGFRSMVVNVAVGGTNHSAHLEGRAADVFPVGIDVRSAFLVLLRGALAFDQIILECDTWIHLAVARDGEPPRQQALVARGSPGHWTYERIQEAP